MTKAAPEKSEPTPSPTPSAESNSGSAPPQTHANELACKEKQAKTDTKRRGFQSLKRQLQKVAVLVALFLATAFAPRLWDGLFPVVIAGIGVIGVIALSAIRERGFGPSRIAEAFTTALAAVLILLCSFFDVDPRLAAITASSLLLSQAIGHLLELLGRRRSGVLATVEGHQPLSVSSSWRDNSAIAAKIRKMALVLEWARYPAAALIGLGVFFFSSESVSEALVSGATALLALSPRTLRMTTGDAHLAAALAALKRGASIRDAHVIDQIASSRIVLYLTGRALIESKLAIVDWKPTDDADEKRVLSALGTVQAKADGRIALAIQEFVQSQGGVVAPIETIELRKGMGLLGDTTFGRTICGSRQLLLAEGISTAVLESQAKTIEASGRRALFVALDEQTVAVFGVEETPVKDTETSNHKLKSLGMEPVMVTTAEVGAAQALGMRLGIENVHFETPETALGAVLGTIRDCGDNAILVGHGAAFEENIRSAAATLAIGGIESTQAGVNAQGNDFRFIPWMIKTAKRTKRSIGINIAAAIGATIVGLALSAGWFSPLVATFVATLGFAAAALSTLNGPYPTIERAFDRINTATKMLKKFSIRKAATPH
ncbi:MAG: cation-translocating P-type ATPase [Proteobacteria bacterium]|nr:cation-translocating P-type ATPase [Pseudomonadota bacterium]